MSPRTKHKEPEPDVREDDELDDEAILRDFVMARLAAGRALAAEAVKECDEALALFVNPSEDAKGKDRKEAVATALELLGSASRAIEAAEEALPDVDYEMGEPWEDDDGDEDEND